tara:strand:- start:161 stop:283 length:123 start_codon:yes stop_codon:yes gene_type:complete
MNDAAAKFSIVVGGATEAARLIGKRIRGVRRQRIRDGDAY